jgi:DNA helicase-2/ATP-dependent DNA helicase PcrA
MDFLKNLNPQQQQAVMAGSGPVLVLAGPGSGKTRVLTARIAYLIGNRHVYPYNVMAVTFTNKAAREMENRVMSLLGTRAQGLTLGTFHAICARILRREADHLPFTSNFVIFDSDDQMDVVRQVLSDLNLDEKRYHPTSVHASISAAKNELIFPQDFPIQTYRDEVVKSIYARYQEILLASNGVDFDDLLLWAVWLFEEHPEVREKYSQRFEQILVDEFQDTNMAQYALLRHLSSFHRNIFVVGDIDQSIYRWRGADYRNVLRFEKDYPEAQIILLEQNYRSTQSILDVAMAVINRNPQRKPKRLFTQRGRGVRVVLHRAADDRQEAAFVVDTIADLVARGEAKPGDFAIMYRTNAQSRLLEEAFLHAGLPYKLVGAQRFYGRREVKDILAYLRLVRNPDDELSLARAINIPPRGIGEKTMAVLKVNANKASMSPGRFLLELGRGEASPHWQALPARAAAVLSQFGLLLAHWRAHLDELPPLGLMDLILQDIEYRDYLEDGTDEGRERWENIMELRRLAAEYLERGLDAFLEDVALISDQDTLDASANVPTLLTLHAAKGLEFPIVFIVGLNDRVLPHVRSFDDPEAMQEERRLFYVGITRAKDRLYFVVPMNRYAYGFCETLEESRFLLDIPASLLEQSGMEQIDVYRPAAREKMDWRKSATTSTLPLQPQYQPGTRVLHPVWGEGMVLNSKIQDDDEIVDIFFEGVGLKRVAASLAKLKVKV